MLRTILLMTALTGCSVALQRKPGDGAVARDCSTSIVYPAVDLAMVALGMVALAASIAYADEWGDGGSAIGGAAVLEGVVYTASGVEGLRSRSACKRARAVASPVALGE